MAIGDSELILATYLAVCALTKRLTGEDICVTLPDAEGHLHSITSQDELITWLKDRKYDRVSPETLEAARKLRRPSVVRVLPS